MESTAASSSLRRTSIHPTAAPAAIFPRFDGALMFLIVLDMVAKPCA
jgi:hypothetical protein